MPEYPRDNWWGGPDFPPAEPRDSADWEINFRIPPPYDAVLFWLAINAIFWHIFGWKVAVSVCLGTPAIVGLCVLLALWEPKKSVRKDKQG